MEIHSSQSGCSSNFRYRFANSGSSRAFCSTCSYHPTKEFHPSLTEQRTTKKEADLQSAKLGGVAAVNLRAGIMRVRRTWP